MLRVDVLPAERGDCIWIEYGNQKDPYRILVDCGTPLTEEVIRARILEILPSSRRQFELLVLTHIDIDHIGGLLPILRDPPPGLYFKDIWLNGYKHLEIDGDMLSVAKAEELTTLLDEKRLPWNEAFHREAIFVSDEGRLPEKILPGGMKITILSPYYNQLKKLRIVWQKEIETIRKINKYLYLGYVEKWASEEFRDDTSITNGSSIAMLAEYHGQTLLLAADAHCDILIKSLDRLAYHRIGTQTKPIPHFINAFKVSHHGSARSISSALIRRIKCNSYLISTNGYKDNHPSRQAIGRILTEDTTPKKLLFNYRTEYTQKWEYRHLKEKYKYEVIYPAFPSNYVSLSLE